MDPGQDILTTEEAAELLRLSPYAVRDMARRGLLPARKVGKGWRFYKPDLVSWVRGGQAGELTPRPGTCCAYTESGAICGAPAAHPDSQRGGMVCERHRKEST